MSDFLHFEIRPFTGMFDIKGFFATVPFFHIQKPSNIEDIKVGQLKDGFLTPSDVFIHRETYQVISKQDLTTFVEYLDSYADYIKTQSKQLTEKYILNTYLRNEANREKVKELIKIYEFQETGKGRY